MRKKIQKPDNQAFADMVDYLRTGFNIKNKLIFDKTGIETQRIADIKFGSTTITKKELADFKEAFKVELSEYVEPTPKLETNDDTFIEKKKVIDNLDFINKTNFLKSVKNLTFDDIANAIEVDTQKFRNIRSGRSSADKYILSKLNDVYATDLLNYTSFDDQVNPIKYQATEYAKKVEIEQQESKIERLEREIEQLKVLVFDNFKRLQKLEED